MQEHSMRAQSRSRKNGRVWRREYEVCGVCETEINELSEGRLR